MRIYADLAGAAGQLISCRIAFGRQCHSVQLELWPETSQLDGWQHHYNWRCLRALSVCLLSGEYTWECAYGV
jgi:hypothetical protein